MEQQILKTINHIKYVSKKGVTISGRQRFLKKKSTTTFDETSLQEIICEMQQNGEIDGKFKIMNPTIYDDKNFAEDPREIHPKTFHPEESVDTTLINSNNDSYSETDISFIDEHINSDDQNKTASDSEITINSMEHHLSDSITSAENLNDKSCDCIARLESLKDEFNLKAANIKRNLVLKIENLKDEITSIRKDIEPTFDKNLIETINKHEGENEKLKDKIKLLQAENKILKDDIGTKQKLIDSLLQHNNFLLTQQERLTAELQTPTNENSCKSGKKDVIQMENNIRQEEIPAKSGISKTNKLPSKKNHSRVIQPIESKNRYSPLESEGIPTENENTKSDSPNTKETGKQKAINTATQNTKNSNNKTESDMPDKRKLPVTDILGDSMVKDIKGWKLSRSTRKVVVKHFSGAKTKEMKSYVIPTVEQKPDNIILHTGTNDLKNIDTPEEITMGILNLAMTCKTDTNSVFISGIVPRSDKLNEKVSKVNSILRHECNVRNICFIDNKHISPRFHCNRSSLHLNYYGTRKLQENFLYELAKLD